MGIFIYSHLRSLAEVTGELRSYPHKFEMEMFKHITMLNRMEKRYDVAPEVAAVLRDLYKGDDNKEKETNEEEEIVKISTISPEELAEIKAEFIGRFIYLERSSNPTDWGIIAVQTCFPYVCIHFWRFNFLADIVYLSGSFPNADDAILVQQALMGELEGFSSESSAQSALRVSVSQLYFNFWLLEVWISRGSRLVGC